MLLQSRFLSDPMLDHERGCFARATHLVDGELEVRNVFAQIPDLEDVTSHDALIIGGSGDFSVVERDQPFFDPLAELLRQVVDTGFPTFGCCFGFQLLVDAMGGTVVKDPARAEIGSFPVELTDEGRDDPLFGQLPPTFVAQMGHFDRASVLPEGVPNLVSSERCFFQALRFPGLPIWASQFHPELDDEGNKARCIAYIKEFGEIRGYTALPSPQALTILPRFLKLVADS